MEEARDTWSQTRRGSETYQTLDASNRVQAAFLKVRKRGQTAASLNADNVKREDEKRPLHRFDYNWRNHSLKSW
jgi:hypothetical protein